MASADAFWVAAAEAAAGERAFAEVRRGVRVVPAGVRGVLLSPVARRGLLQLAFVRPAERPLVSFELVADEAALASPLSSKG